MAASGSRPHSHQMAVHSHEHIHMTHYAHQGSRGDVEHLMSSHAHAHDHASLEHAHGPHEDPQGEHEREAHIHDHRHPVEA